MQLISIGVLGEYLGRMSEETKHRPVFVARSVSGALKERLKNGANYTHNGVCFNEAAQPSESPKAETADKSSKNVAGA